MIRLFLKERILAKEFAEKRKIPLNVLVKETGLGKNTLSRMQNIFGYNVTTETLNKLCVYFDCKLSDLAEYVPDEPSSGD